MLITDMRINSSICNDYDVIDANQIQCFYSATKALVIMFYNDKDSVTYTLRYDEDANSNLMIEWFYNELVK